MFLPGIPAPLAVLNLQNHDGDDADDTDYDGDDKEQNTYTVHTKIFITSMSSQRILLF